MPGFLKQSTASQTRTIGPFVDDTDFKTLENGLTIANTDVVIKKNGAASGTKNSGGATADGSGGLYHLTWDATDTATVGELKISVKVAGALVFFDSYTVLEEAVYDMLFGASAIGYIANQPVDVNTIKTQTVTCSGGVTVPAATLASTTNITAAAGCAVSSIGSSVITATSIAADAITDAKVASDVTIASVTGAVGSVTGAVGSVTGNVGGNVTGSVGSVVGAVGSVTGNVGGNVTGSVGSVAAGGITASSIAADAIGASELAADAVAEIAAGVWDLATSGHTTSGTFGAAAVAAGGAGDPWSTSLPGSYGAGTAGKIIGDNINATISGRASQTSLDALVTTVGVAGLGLSAIPKTGYKLASDGLDSISVTAPTGVASNFREMLVQVWRRFFKKATLTSTQLKTYADDGTTVVTTQTVSEDSTTQTQGAGS
jgi:uncharacterized protein YjbJ (UPF0337 family)